MPSPVLPADVKAIISDPTSSLCGNFVNTLLKAPVLAYNFIKWLIGDDGNFTRAAIQQIHHPGDLILSAAPLAADDNRLLCDGSVVSQTTYADLYAAISTIYNTGGEGAGNFRLPDFRARFPVGVGTFPSAATAALGVPGGEETHVLTGDEFIGPTHEHTVGRMSTDSGAGGDDGYFKPGTATPAQSGNYRIVAGNIGAPRTTDVTTLTGAVLVSGDVNDAPTITGHNNIPPYFACYVYIAA